MASTTSDVAVIGGGPAGLACAISAASLGLDVTIVEAKGVGGQLLKMAELRGVAGQSDGVMGPDLAASLMVQAMDGGAAIEYGSVADVSSTASGWSLSGPTLDTLSARTVVVAVGSMSAPLGVPGEIEFASRGVSDCAVCDGPLYAGKPVVVVGSTPVALYEAAHLTTIASRVTLLAPRTGGRTRRSVSLASTDNRGFEAIADVDIETILGEDTVRRVAYVDARGERHEIDAAAVFVAHRRHPPLNPVASAVDADEDGRIIVNHNLAALSTGIFAVGDVRSGSPHSIPAALADGHLAAEYALELLSGPE